MKLFAKISFNFLSKVFQHRIYGYPRHCLDSKTNEMHFNEADTPNCANRVVEPVPLINIHERPDKTELWIMQSTLISPEIARIVV